MKYCDIGTRGGLGSDAGWLAAHRRERRGPTIRDGLEGRGPRGLLPREGCWARGLVAKTVDDSTGQPLDDS